MFVLVVLFAKKRPHRTGADSKRGQGSTCQRASTTAVAADAAGGIGSGSGGGIGQESGADHGPTFRLCLEGRRA